VDFAPVLGIDLRTESCVVLDLSVGSPLVGGDPGDNAEPALTSRVFGVMRHAGVHVAVGRWDEPRLLYTAPFFATGSLPPDDRRTIHIGLDLFAEAGTPVYAPLDGVVHALADNDVPQDYGPVIVLRHETDGGAEFFTLYGHLSRASLHGLKPGRRLARGERFAALGTPDENVGWTPHLHLQIVTDLLGLGTDFPGVAPARHRSVWRSLSPDPNLLVGVPHTRFPSPPPTRVQALAARRARVGGNVSLAYREPLRLARGWRQWLWDDDGRRYLDAYNNVPHVGHCHPRVVRAGQAQMAVLNTNTRYLSDLLATYTERLVATMPAPLEVCYLVNSASEANELALRLARAATGRMDMIVLEAAYHGHTTGLIDLSPYKHAGPGGGGAPEWVHVAPLPDDYRGTYRRGTPAIGQAYARDVRTIVERLSSTGHAPAGFIAETCPSVGGQLLLPTGYLAEVYRYVRAAGGVCIADEVQTGLGRMGTHFWAFEAHDVVPDVVVMGKPLGNGHPMAAVVTTRALADAFDNGMEFFSTFGGNQVSCAIGLAVLDVLRDEQLQQHALAIGARLLAGLRPLAERHEIVGDVRGSGLFLGVELVRDRATRAPAGAEASLVANRMREAGILLGTDGPHHNVVKIRPPMPFDAADADRLVETLDRVLTESFG
jgi:4-aminobutyrate aminotransferase-like enzyme